ncbi:MAG: hypothetical protein AVDCRST_MAG59-2172 [uncultured Thermomicrobiales bacterium]|uniref:Uncharacterized protein n=1 Tax=uncultured Thermomicrobiales bacterium TaxID=1645740 RepID=A0A6J4URN4_9BACT|nr:MAG: hypothetical protein AVDCRST_MAG59-2172 [uncultured Thermomicrobiales bacterium]
MTGRGTGLDCRPGHLSDERLAGSLVQRLLATRAVDADPARIGRSTLLSAWLRVLPGACRVWS